MTTAAVLRLAAPVAATGTNLAILAAMLLSSTGSFAASTQVCYTSAASIPRDESGHVKRNPAARRQFMLHTGYPHGRPGYVIDHIIPLKRGGCDDPSNMQWQTIRDAKEKDRWE